MTVYTPEQWAEAHRLYMEGLLTYRQVAEQTGINYESLAKKAASQNWSQDQRIMRAQREDARRKETLASQALIDRLLTERDPQALAQLTHAYTNLKRISSDQLPRKQQREFVAEFLVELFGWMAEECPAALAALRDNQRGLQQWMETKYGS